MNAPSLKAAVKLGSSKLVVDPAHVSFASLREAVRAMREKGQTVQPLITDLHHKIAGPLASLLMPFLAAVAAFGFTRRRRGRGYGQRHDP